MKKLLMVLNDVGNVGKSTLSTLMEGYCRRRGLRTVKLCTGENDLTIEDEARGARFWDLDDPEEAITGLIGNMDSHDMVIVDTHSGALEALEAFFEDNEVHELLSEIETELTVVVPVGDHDDHLDHLVEIAEAFADNNNYVVVHSGQASEFESLWSGSYAEKVMSYLDAETIEIPAPNMSMLFELASLGVSVRDARNARETLPSDICRSLEAWEEASLAQLDAAREILFGELAALKSPNPSRKSNIALGS